MWVAGIGLSRNFLEFVAKNGVRRILGGKAVEGNGLNGSAH